MKTAKLKNNRAESLINGLFLILIVGIMGFIILKIQIDRHDLGFNYAKEMNVAAENYAATHHLKPGAELRPESLVKAGQCIWWQSSNGHSMPVDESHGNLFTKAIVPEDGKPYVKFE